MSKDRPDSVKIKVGGALDQGTNSGSPLKPRINIPGYDILAKAGEGASAVVWRARQLSLDRIVAIKILNHELSTSEEDVADFLREARAIASLKHPRLIPIFDVGESDGLFYFVMEFVYGRTIGEVLRAEGNLPEQRALLYTRHVAEVLDYAWKNHRIIHRDIKPDNIILENNTVARLADLGLVGVATPNGLAGDHGDDIIVGTPNYISPEQAQNDPKTDFHTDMYALGASLYHMVTGILPFHGQDTNDVLTAQITQTIENPHVLNPAISQGCAQLIRRLMMKRPADRYPSWEAVIADIKRVEEGKPLPNRKRAKSTVSPPPAAAATEGTRPAATPGRPGVRVETGATPQAAARATAAARKRENKPSPALHVFLWILLLGWLGFFGYRMLDLPKQPRILRRETPRGRETTGTSRTQQPTAVPQPVEPRDTPPSATEYVTSEPTPPPPTEPHATLAQTTTGILTALLVNDYDAARSAFRTAAASGMTSQLADLGTCIDATEAASRLVRGGFRSKIGQKDVIEVGGRRADIVVTGVTSDQVQIKMIASDGTQRPASFDVSRLSPVEQSRWIGTPDSPAKAMAKMVLLMRGGDLMQAREMAARTGPAAPLFGAEIDRRIELVTNQ